MSDDAIHIECCATCGKLLNALPQSDQSVERNGVYYHNTSYCLPADARSRAEALWGNVFTFTGGNGLESR
jgi:hypothetical protein